VTSLITKKCLYGFHALSRWIWDNPPHPHTHPMFLAQENWIGSYVVLPFLEF
jgi:hypothetical protein